MSGTSVRDVFGEDGRSGQLVADAVGVVDDGLQLGAVGLERAGGLAQGHGEAADLGVPYGLLTGGLAGRSASGQDRQAGVGERASGELAVAVVAAQQQRAQPVGLRGVAAASHRT